MGKKEKLIQRLRSMPKDFTYEELRTLLQYLGYEEGNAGKTSGSAVRFVHKQTRHTIRIHKPHPGNILKRYIIDFILESLTKEGLL